MTYEIGTTIIHEQPVAVERATLTVAEIGAWLAKTYGDVAGLLAAQGLQPAGAPFARYHPLGDDRFDVEAGFPTPTPIEAGGEVRPSTLPGGPVAQTVHTGPYEEMEPGYAALASWIAEQGGEPAGDAWEVYYSNPDDQPDSSTWRTLIVQPYRSAGAP